MDTVLLSSLFIPNWQLIFWCYLLICLSVLLCIHTPSFFILYTISLILFLLCIDSSNLWLQFFRCFLEYSQTKDFYRQNDRILLGSPCYYCSYNKSSFCHTMCSLPYKSWFIYCFSSLIQIIIIWFKYLSVLTKLISVLKTTKCNLLSISEIMRIIKS